ncbi:MAG: outer membrane beta-barrel protein [Terracidiphilus sp.]
MRRFSSLFFSILLLAGAVNTGAQVVPSATGRQVTITAGGMASIFQPDFAGNFQPPDYINPIAQASHQPLFGVGAYVDVRLRRWVQFEAEGRWMRWNQYYGISQDNYLIGPRLPVHRFWNEKATVYGKALAGYSRMTFDPLSDYGRYTDIAVGGGMDIKLTKKISLRAVDVEYHYWPWWQGTKLTPYGASVGIGYKIF